MEILRTISLYVEGKNMPFVLIGGHAVNAYGISRQTGDLDLLVQRSRKPAWEELLAKLRYTKGQDDERFARFRPDTIAAWPLDLMYVDEGTFEKLYSEAHSVDAGATTVKAASPRHLVALKIHALKHFQEHRHAKDFNDVLELLRLKDNQISREDLRDLCIKYADLPLFEKIVNGLKG
jgi:hypothetical protein